MVAMSTGLNFKERSHFASSVPPHLVSHSKLQNDYDSIAINKFAHDNLDPNFFVV